MHQPSPTIELIAGNATEDRIVWGGIAQPFEAISTMQRACLGNNTKDGLKELSEIVGEIWSAVYNLSLIQAGFNSVVGVDPLRPWVAAAAPATTIAALDFVINSLWNTRINALFWEFNYLRPFGYKYICSTNVKLC